MQCVGPRARNNVNLGAGYDTVLGGVAVSGDSEFLNRVYRWTYGDSVVIGVHKIDTIECEIVIGIALASYGKTYVATGCPPLCLGAAGLWFTHSGNQQG